MPDMFDTEIVAFGNAKDVNDLFASLSTENGGFSFNRYIPEPPFHPLDSSNDQREWRVGNWFTKWDCDDVKINLYSEGDLHHVMICYSCPWTSSFPVSERLAKLHPQLKFIKKFGIEPDRRASGICTFSVEDEFTDVLAEYWDRDGAVTYDGATKFLDLWATNPSVCRAMTLLGYGEKERTICTSYFQNHLSFQINN